jgi:hypothetical protein
LFVLYSEKKGYQTLIDTFWESSFVDGFRNCGEIFTYDVPRSNKEFDHNAI